MIEFVIFGVGIFVTGLVAYALVLIQQIETAAHTHTAEEPEGESPSASAAAAYVAPKAA